MPRSRSALCLRLLCPLPYPYNGLRQTRSASPQVKCVDLRAHKTPSVCYEYHNSEFIKHHLPERDGSTCECYIMLLLLAEGLLYLYFYNATVTGTIVLSPLMPAPVTSGQVKNSFLIGWLTPCGCLAADRVPGHPGNTGLNTLAGHWSSSKSYQR
ncbi:hypothetical protein RRG08_035356 [Elysia crispata]|uniref:Uncharacterized protein n=1 Tax=Elysia crispata TaxID=231223 RepID=A0AAE0Y3B3_9GAST|nr:hypothetical protein RRG08_035356 [Elysia crispata]